LTPPGCTENRIPVTDRAVTVKIAGRNYHLQADGSGEDVRAAAAMVDSRLREIGNQISDAPLEKVAVLTLVHMADELLQATKQIERFDSFIDAQTSQIEAVLRD
jgi:cell division protein ZapA (FtsZ GTPase activity inhibitor)